MWKSKHLHDVKQCNTAVVDSLCVVAQLSYRKVFKIIILIIIFNIYM